MRTPRAATTAMLAVVLLVACRSHKETTATTKEQFDIEAAGSSSTKLSSQASCEAVLRQEVKANVELSVLKVHPAGPLVDAEDCRFRELRKSLCSRLTDQLLN